MSILSVLMAGFSQRGYEIFDLHLCTQSGMIHKRQTLKKKKGDDNNWRESRMLGWDLVIKLTGPCTSRELTSADFTVSLSDTLIILIEDNIIVVYMMLFYQWSHCDHLTADLTKSCFFLLSGRIRFSPPQAGLLFRFQTVSRLGYKEEK